MNVSTELSSNLATFAGFAGSLGVLLYLVTAIGGDRASGLFSGSLCLAVSFCLGGAAVLSVESPTIWALVGGATLLVLGVVVVGTILSSLWKSLRDAFS
ncbi:MAG: hypothetical protein WBK28_02100 [Minisyncoccia bacterium]